MQRFKDCYGLPEQGNKYNIPHLKVSLEAIFSEMNRANKKVFIFWQGNCTMNILHPSLLKSFALSICSRDPMKNSTLGYFCKRKYSQCIASCNHDGSVEDNYCVLFFKLKFLIPTSCHMFFSCQRLQKFTGKVNLKVPFRKISCTFVQFLYKKIINKMYIFVV